MRKFIHYTGILFITALILVSCGKEGDTIAKVTVTDAAGDPVSGAFVKVTGVDSQGENGGLIERDATSDATGVATFNFNDLYKRGQAGFAVLEIYAEKDSLWGEGIIKVEEEKTSEATVVIQYQ